jgi:hypothetical protein
MVDHLSNDDLDQIEQRLDAALNLIPPPWESLCETKSGLGGESFIRGSDPVLDHEIYVTLNLAGEVVRGPDERKDEMIEFLGHSAEDIQRLIAEVRRLRSAQ